jgi:hypothetical protein
MNASNGKKGKQPTDPVIRFWRNVTRSDWCWNWSGSKNALGYGRLFISKTKAVMAHRFSWEIHQGQIPKGLLVLHRCDTPSCVRPDHLFLGTSKDNSQDMVKKIRNKRGTGHHNAKLTEDQVRMILRAKKGNGRFWGRKEMAKKLGLSLTHIRAIANGKWWKHVSV